MSLNIGMRILYDQYGIKYSKMASVHFHCFTSFSRVNKALEPDADAQTNADRIISKIVPLGQRFYPSESAFPLREYLRLPIFPADVQCYM